MISYWIELKLSILKSNNIIVDCRCRKILNFSDYTDQNKFFVDTTIAVFPIAFKNQIFAIYGIFK